jgi:hypothetical protein
MVDSIAGLRGLRQTITRPCNSAGPSRGGPKAFGWPGHCCAIAFECPGTRFVWNTAAILDWIPALPSRPRRPSVKRTKPTGKRSANSTRRAFVENAATQSILQQVQLGLAHRTVESEKAVTKADGSFLADLLSK